MPIIIGIGIALYEFGIRSKLLGMFPAKPQDAFELPDMDWEHLNTHQDLNVDTQESYNLMYRLSTGCSKYDQNFAAVQTWLDNAQTDTLGDLVFQYLAQHPV